MGQVHFVVEHPQRDRGEREDIRFRFEQGKTTMPLHPSLSARGRRVVCQGCFYSMNWVTTFPAPTLRGVHRLSWTLSVLEFMDARLTILCLLLLPIAPAWGRSKTDVIVMKNNDHFTCEIKRLDRGVL